MRYKRNRQVFVEYRDGVTATTPLENRTYTMTHSDDTGDLFVTIGLTLAQDKTNELRDEVYLTWQRLGNKNLLYGEVLIDGINLLEELSDINLLYGEVLIDGEGIQGTSKIRNDIFRREMPLALQAIYVADTPLFEACPHLNDTPIIINFKSADPTYNKLYTYGTIGNYNNSSRNPFKIPLK